MSATDYVHSYSAYVNYGCRCSTCREASRVYKARYRRRQRATVEDQKKGTVQTP
jgi:hypothetical protein